MRTLLASALFAASLSVAATASAATATTQIYLQRTDDGRATLTDRPASGTKIERTWQLDAEDRVAARQRALEVAAEAQAVSERVQRSIDLRLRLADAEQDRMARSSASRQRSNYDDSYDGLDDGEAIIAPYAFGRGARGNRNVRPAPRPHTGFTASHFAHLTGSAPLGSR